MNLGKSTVPRQSCILKRGDEVVHVRGMTDYAMKQVETDVSHHHLL